MHAWTGGSRWAAGTALAALLLAGCSAPPTSPSPSATVVDPGSATGTVVPSAPAPTASPTAGVATTSATAARPCVGAPAPTTWRHVIWIWFENKPASGVLGSPQAPYLDGLATGCASASDYHGVTHPSLPNYLAATSGSTHGVADDGPPSAHPLAGPSLFSQVADSGRQWRSYEEAMPSPCALASAGRYAVKHNPAAYFTAIRRDCARWDVGLDQLSTDLAAHQLPAFALVTPDLCHDMHDCSVATGDAWLRDTLPALLASPEYADGSTAVLITWDEADGGLGNQVPLLVVAPSITPGTTIAGRLDHYALLHTTEQMLGLPPLGAAAGAPTIPGL